MNNLKSRRIELGLTQPQVSAWLRSVDSRYDVGMVSRLENGVCLPTPSVLDALCEVLQAAKSDLYGDNDLEAVKLHSEADEQLTEVPAHLKRVVDLIPLGSENAISRRYLRTLSGLSDRMLRDKIEAARGVGVLICNDGNGSGYYIATDIDEIEAQYHKDQARALSVLYRLKTSRRILKDAGRPV